ncbi:MAG: hypothetical protein IPK87_14970 [Planctomycetes bacterium]|nr:hypothetical protein [Planctomycetota bacterium]
MTNARDPETFYHVGKPGPDDDESCTEFETSDDAQFVDDGVVCPSCRSPLDHLTWVPPYLTELECWNREFTDFVFGFGSLLLSERSLAAIRSSGLIGIGKADSVEVIKVRKHKRFQGNPPSYFLVEVVVSKAAVDLEASGFEHEGNVCLECRTGQILKRWKRVVFESGTWSGEDIFRPIGKRASFFCTRRFRDFCLEHKFTGAVFLPAEKYNHDFYPNEKPKK